MNFVLLTIVRVVDTMGSSYNYIFVIKPFFLSGIQLENKIKIKPFIVLTLLYFTTSKKHFNFVTQNTLAIN